MVRRILRDVGILIGFCGCFYLLIVVVGELEGSDETLEDFSRDRRRADVYYRRQNWNVAADSYKRLTEEDPYNGRAWYMLASCYNSKAYDDLSLINDVVEDGSAESENQIKKLEESSQAHFKTAKSYFETSSRFARFRIDSVVRLSVILCELDDHDSALQRLTEFVELGGTTQMGLDRYRQFGVGGEQMTSQSANVVEATRLHQYEQFWELVAKEGKNKGRR